MTTMASKEEINVFHGYFEELIALFDWALQKTSSILLLQISLDTRWQNLKSVEPKLWD